ncbi:MAG: crossover junction endodeoxyribonuclease RuvC [Candidatus Pacebacteria bacterium]|nr:crossover junction endodeoxyribonuclease RuvC [Candidatus Paceibacterota bacterium]
MKILAIDPGYERLGIAILEKNKSDKKEKLLYSDCFKTSAKIPFCERLVLIGDQIEKIIEIYKPAALSIETLFITNNQKTAMHVAEARGVIIYEASRAGLSVSEYTPLQVKLATTGHGSGDKKQIIKMLPNLISLNKEIRHDDEYDAIALGITYFAYNKI